MKIVTYNFQFNGAGLQDWLPIIDAFDPDVILSQESRPPPAALAPTAVWFPAAGRSWGSAVYVKGKHLTPLALDEFQGWLVGAEVDSFPHLAPSGRRLRLFSLHAPPSEVSGAGYPTTVDRMLNVIRNRRGEADLIIGGDFNLTVGERHHSERKDDGRVWATTPEERAIQNRLRDEFGLINCWQTANPCVPLAQTLRWSNNPGPSYHCDAIFVPAAWRTRVFCTVIDNEEWTGRDAARLPQSDHNPLVAWLPGPTQPERGGR